MGALITSFPVSTTAIRSTSFEGNNNSKEIGEQKSSSTDQIHQEVSEEDVGEEIFGLDDFYETDDYYDSSNSNITESKSPITVLLTIGGQVDHECDDEHVMGEDGKCYKLETHYDVEEALNYLKKQARSCLKCIASYIFYDYTDAEGNEEEYTDFDEIFDKRTINFPR